MPKEKGFPQERRLQILMSSVESADMVKGLVRDGAALAGRSVSGFLERLLLERLAPTELSQYYAQHLYPLANEGAEGGYGLFNCLRLLAEDCLCSAALRNSLTFSAEFLGFLQGYCQRYGFLFSFNEEDAEKLVEFLQALPCQVEVNLPLTEEVRRVIEDLQEFPEDVSPGQLFNLLSRGVSSWGKCPGVYKAVLFALDHIEPRWECTSYKEDAEDRLCFMSLVNLAGSCVEGSAKRTSLAENQLVVDEAGIKKN